MRAAGGTASPSRTRVATFRLLVVVLALGALLPGFGLADLTVPVNPSWDEAWVPEVGYGALAGILLPVGLLSQLRDAERRIAGLQQVAAAVPAYLAAGVLGDDGDFLPFAAILAASTGAAVALHPARRRFLGNARVRPVLALLAVAMAGAAVVYGIEAAANQRDGVTPLAFDSHGPLNSWAALAAAAFALALVALLTALGTDGFAIPGWSAAAAAAVWGLASLARPDEPGSQGRVWAALALAWAIVFVAAVERERRARPRSEESVSRGRPWLVRRAGR